MPRPDHSAVAVPPPGTAPGTWAGAPSAIRSNGDFYLAYRLRRPLGQGRGYAVAVARSADGVRFETLLTIGKAEMDAESLERPALVQNPLRHLAAIPELRDDWHQALARRGARGG